MKRILTAALALALMSGTVVMAQPTGPDRNGPGNNGQERLNNPGARGGSLSIGADSAFRRNTGTISDTW